MTKISFYILDVDYRVIGPDVFVELYCRTESGEQMLLLDRSVKPYFLVELKSGESSSQYMEKGLRIRNEIKGKTYSVISTELVRKIHFGSEKQLIKILVNEPSAVPSLREIFKSHEEVKEVYEADILFSRRYLVDKMVKPMVLCQAELNEDEINDYGARIPTFEITDIQQSSDKTYEQPRILAFDIETYNPLGKQVVPEAHPIVMAAFAGDSFRKVITWKVFDTKEDYIVFVRSEAELIEEIKRTISEYKADIITGYFSDGFDFPYLKTRAEKYKIDLDLGLDGSGLKVDNRVEQTESKITGLVHLDVFKFIKRVVGRSMETDSYKLNSVAQELIGEGKDEIDVSTLADVWDNNPENLERFCRYNLQDAAITLKLAHKTMPQILELMKIVGMPLYDVTRMGFSQLVEWFLIKQSVNYDELIPNKPNHQEISERRSHTYEGGFVFEPKPGFYENIVVYDFRSLYPTIIVSHNISPGSLRCSCCKDSANKVPISIDGKEQEIWFCKKKKEFIPLILEEIIKRRMRIKEMILDEKKRTKEQGQAYKKNPLLDARQNSLKLLANSFYGYLGFFRARWYSLESAKSTTAYGRHYINSVIDQAKRSGFNVVYADTDSVFLNLVNKTMDDSKKFAEAINMNLPEYMELEFDGSYKSGIFVFSRGGTGAKKRYALLSDEGNIVVKGFETVRRNWSFIGKSVQQKVLEMILREKDPKKALDYVRSVVSDIKEHRVPVESLVIITQLQKEISDYDSVGPHVAVARIMQGKGIPVGPGSIIKYVVTQGGSVIRDRAKMPEDVAQTEYDSAYYIDHQIIPAVDRLFEVLGYSKEELMGKKKQSKLDAFF